MAHIIVRSLAERAFDHVRSMIIAGRLPENEPIRQDSIAAELGISKIPLREALARLEHEGLLISQTNRGWFVPPLSTEQAAEIFALRLAIEPAAAAHGCTIAVAADHRVAAEAFARLRAARSVGRGEALTCQRHFLLTLIQPGQRLLTRQLVERLAVLAERYLFAWAASGESAHNAPALQHLFEAWKAGDAVRVHAMLTAHLAAQRDHLLARE